MSYRSKFAKSMPALPTKFEPDVLFDPPPLGVVPSVEFSTSIDALACYYAVGGNLLITVVDGLPDIPPDRVADQRGTILIEQTFDSGRNWHAFQALKIGRGMNVNAVAHLAKLRAALEPPPPTVRAAIRARIDGPNVTPMQPVTVAMVFAGVLAQHQLRFNDEYVVQEMP